MVADKPFGQTFSYVSGAPEALVSYFKWFGGQPVGKVPYVLRVFLSGSTFGGNH